MGTPWFRVTLINFGGGSSVKASTKTKKTLNHLNKTLCELAVDCPAEMVSREFGRMLFSNRHRSTALKQLEVERAPDRNVIPLVAVLVHLAMSMRVQKLQTRIFIDFGKA